MPCIFCGSERNLTIEHLFPAALGGQLVVCEGSCAECNRDFGGSFEDQFIRDTEVLRNILRIPNRYGEVPAAHIHAVVEGLNVPARRNADGEIQLNNCVEEIPLQNGGIERRGFFFNPLDCERFEQRAIARGQRVVGGKDGRDIVVRPVTNVPLMFVFSREARRTAAKVALVAVAYWYGVEYACCNYFDQLREYIRLD